MLDRLDCRAGVFSDCRSEPRPQALGGGGGGDGHPSRALKRARGGVGLGRGGACHLPIEIWIAVLQRLQRWELGPPLHLLLANRLSQQLSG